MNILLTGATGFIGRHLLAFLLSKNIQVTAVVRNREKLYHYHKKERSLNIVEGDLNKSSTFAELPAHSDVLIHLAAVLGDWSAEETKITSTNVNMTERLLNWFATSEGKQFIFISTPGVQGFGYSCAREDAPYNPRGLYEKTKVLAELKIRECVLRPDKSWTILRPDFVYGPGDTRRLRLYKMIRRRLWLRIGRGSSVLRPTYVLDLCNAVFLCLKNHKAYNQIFNVAGPEVVSVDEYIDTIASLLRVNLPPFRLPTLAIKIGATICELAALLSKTSPLATRSQVEFLTQNHATDISKIKHLLGFTPTVDLYTGMKKTLTWARDSNLL